MANPALIDELEKQFRDNPRRVFARLANEYRKSGDFMRAIEICHAHVPQQPGYISGHIVLGQALFDAGEFDQAQQTFQTALSLDPENLIALRQLGDIARTRRDYREARSWYTRLLEVDPQNDEIVAQLGEIALAEGETGEASAEQEQTLDVATAVATADEDRVPEPISLDASTTDADGFAHDDIGAHSDESPEEPHADITPEHVSIIEDQAEPDPSEYAVQDLMLSEELTFESLPSEPAAPQATEPDEDIAWLSTESQEFTISEPERADDADFVVSEAGQDDADSFADSDDDFRITFENEEFEESPLRPHTGESLSIIADEDPLAGVQPVRAADRTPFGDPVVPPAAPSEPDPIDAAFEAMPDEEIDAAADQPRIEDLGGESLADEMAGWSSSEKEPEAEEPEPSPLAAEAYEAADAERDDAFITSEIETIVEESVTESVTYEVTESEDEIDLAFAESGWESQGTAQETSAPSDSVRVSSGEMETEPAAENEPAEMEPAAMPEPAEDESGSSAFVTETMAELYLQQGFRNEALDVYRKLAAQFPDDASLRDRIKDLEGRGAAPVQRSDDEQVAPLQRSAAAFFKSLASIEPPPPPTPDEPESETNPWDELLSDAGEVSEHDDSAAAALSNGYHPPAPDPRGSAVRAADSKLSLHDIFGSAEQASRNSAGSLEAFFTPEGERISGDEHDEEGREDLEAFNAWLEGLKK